MPVRRWVDISRARSRSPSPSDSPFRSRSPSSSFSSENAALLQEICDYISGSNDTTEFSTEETAVLADEVAGWLKKHPVPHEPEDFGSIPSPQKFDRWMQSILEELIDASHKAQHKKEAVMASTVASILYRLDSVGKDTFTRLAMSTIPKPVRSEFGKSTWSTESIGNLAPELNKTLLDRTGVYAFHLKQPDDFYVGQTLASFFARWKQHNKHITMKAESFRKEYQRRRCSLSVFYEAAQKRLKTDRSRCVLADLTRFHDDTTVHSLLATVLESAFCIFFKTFQINNFDSLDTVRFALEARPKDMPEVSWKGLNHAFPMSQGLRLNVWRRKEIYILENNAFTTLDARNKINLICQIKLAEAGYSRSIQAINAKRLHLGLKLEQQETLEIEGERISRLENEVAERICSTFADEPRHVQVDLFEDALKEFGISRSEDQCRRMLIRLFPNDAVPTQMQIPEHWQLDLAAEIKKRHGRSGKLISMASELRIALAAKGKSRSPRSCKNIFETRWQGQSSRVKWTTEQDEIIWKLRDEHPTKGSRALATILVEHLKRDFDIDRGWGTCQTHIYALLYKGDPFTDEELALIPPLQAENPDKDRDALVPLFVKRIKTALNKVRTWGQCMVKLHEAIPAETAEITEEVA